MLKTITALLATIFFLTCSPTGLCQQKSDLKKPDRTRVLPNMTEGVEQQGSMIFTYVDEKRRRRLTLDLYRPQNGEGPFPAIVMYFGGGWQNGRPGLFAPLAQALTQRGYVCVVPEYRLSSEAPFPAAVHDCKAAIRWTRKNAKRFKIDPDRIACMGGSAGGHLAGFVGASNGIERFEGGGDHREHSSEVQAAIVMCGPMDLLQTDMIKRIESADKAVGHAVIDFMGGALPSEDKKIYREASPLSHLSKKSPPMLFIDGEFDNPRNRYTEFWAKMDELKIPHKFVLMPKAPHPFWNAREWFDPTVDAVNQFLQSHLSATLDDGDVRHDQQRIETWKTMIARMPTIPNDDLRDQIHVQKDIVEIVFVANKLCNLEEDVLRETISHLLKDGGAEAEIKTDLLLRYIFVLPEDVSSDSPHYPALKSIWFSLPGNKSGRFDPRLPWREDKQGRMVLSLSTTRQFVTFTGIPIDYVAKFDYFTKTFKRRSLQK